MSESFTAACRCAECREGKARGGDCRECGADMPRFEYRVCDHCLEERMVKELREGWGGCP